MSARNGCHYCATHHSESFGKYAKDPDLVRAVGSHYTSAPIDARDRAMIDYATKLTAKPDRITEGDVERLRTAGLATDIVEIAINHAMVVSTET